MRLDEVPAHAARSWGELRPWMSRERQAMGELLTSWPWRVFCTWQFKSRIGEDGAVREVRRWLDLLRFAWGGEVGWMIGLEQGHGDEWPHVHGLVCGDRVGEPTTLYAGKRHQRTVPLLEPFWLAWKERHGGGRFEVITGDTRGCSFYCAKYAAKRGLIEFSANLERFRGRGAALAPVTLYPGERQYELGDGAPP